jgi:hypothetical protein
LKFDPVMRTVMSELPAVAPAGEIAVMDGASAGGAAGVMGVVDVGVDVGRAGFPPQPHRIPNDRTRTIKRI